MPIEGGSPTTLVSGLEGPTTVVVDATSVYFTDSEAGTVEKVALGGGTPKVLATGQDYPIGIAVDSSGDVPAVAAPVEGTVGEVVQFVNLDAYDPTSLTLRSAAGFPGATGFPAVPYTFAAADYSVLNTVIGSAAWSTGLILPSPTTSAPCYSQTFSLSQAGTYYFGDVLYYNAYVTSPRGVVVVTSAAGTNARRGRRSLGPRR